MWLGNEKKPMKKNPDRLQELKNDIRGEILLKVSSRVPAHTIISLWFWSGDANHKPACARKSGRSCREKGQTAERLQMATLRRRGTFDAQEVKDSLFFSAFFSFWLYSLISPEVKAQEPQAGLLTAWSRAPPCSASSHELNSDHQSWLVGCAVWLMLEGKVQVLTEAVTNVAHFLASRRSNSIEIKAF